MEEFNNIPSIQDQDEESGFDFKKIIPLVLIYWPWIVLSVIICLSGAYFYLRYTPRVYSGMIKVLVKDDSSAGRRRASGIDISHMDGMITSNNGFDNEMEIVRSSYMAIRAVKKLKLYSTYTLEGRVQDQELYKTSPVLVDLEESRLDDLNTSIYIDLKREKNKISMHCYAGSPDAPAYSLDKQLDSLPTTISTPYGALLLTPNPASELGGRVLHARISPVSAIARSYASRLSTTQTAKGTSVADFSFVDTDPNRILDYLTSIVECYNEDANEDKNEVGRRTETFINERLNMIRGELNETELDLQIFKQDHGLINLATDASTALASSNEFQRRQVEMQTQMTIVKSLIDYVSNPANTYKVLPSSSLVSNGSIQRQIDNYNDAVMERNRLIKTSSETSPIIIKLNETIESTLPLIQQSMLAYYQDLETQKRSVDQQYARFTGKVANTPSQERELTNIMRQQEIKASLYLTLLQKREENAISLASTAAKARVIDAPILLGVVSPKSSMIWGIALAIGLGLPIGIMLLLELMRYRIESRSDIEALTKLTILADIPLSSQIKKGERAIVVRENSNDMMEEAFRGLRTNLRFVLSGEEKVLLCTSVIPGEGKTFVATNLAMSMALLGKRVLVMGLDIRKPRLVKLFGLDSNKQGLTNYLMTDGSDTKLLDEQIFHGVINSNLDVLPAGVIPPNPTELIARPQLKMAITHLRQTYDIIIIDTPPLGLVSDTLDIASQADASLVVCRSEVSPKANFDLINNVAKTGKLPKLNIVFNGIDFKSRKYGYYYGYGKYGHYGRYGKYYGHYGAYGTYGNYGDRAEKSNNMGGGN